MNSPNYYLDPNAGRPGRIHQWNINVQREVMKNLVVEAAYVGNRGAWLTGATGLVSMNAISDQRLAAFGLNRNNPADLQLLTSRIDSPLAASRGFKAPYAGFPAGQTVAQSLRPYPQFSSGLSPMWAPLGNNWYDSLQVKATKRYSHGLDFTAAFTWAKELVTGQGVNDVFNRGNQKSLASTSQPFLFVLALQLRDAEAHGEPGDPERGRRLDLGRIVPLYERHTDSGPVLAGQPERDSLSGHADEPGSR